MDGIARIDADERRELFTEAAAQWGNITDEVIEKDFWVCWTLKELFALEDGEARFIFKGGTSLSKVFRLIERFSEDIDLTISRRAFGYTDEFEKFDELSGKKQERLRKELKARAQAFVAGPFREGLIERFSAILGPGGSPDDAWGIELATDDNDLQTLNFRYPAAIEPSSEQPYVRRMVRLEMGARGEHWPAESHPIRPYAAEVFPGSFENPECVVRTLAAERTFCEKATLIHEACNRPASGPPLPLRHSRHYYDLVKLFERGVGEKALSDRKLIEDVVSNKERFFYRPYSDFQAALAGRFRLMPPAEQLATIRADYRVMQETMFFAESYSFDELMEKIAQVEARLNASVD